MESQPLVCGHSHDGHHHHGHHKHHHKPHGNQREDDHEEAKSEKSTLGLWVVVILTAGITMLLLVFGISFGSMALVSEGIHHVSDLIVYCINLYLFRLAMKPQNEAYPYGLARSSVLGGLINGAFLASASLMILFSSIERFQDPSTDIDEDTMVFLGLGTIVVNGIGMGILCASGHGHGHVHMGGGDCDAQGHGHSHGHGHGSSSTNYDMNMCGMLLHLIIDFASGVLVVVSGLLLHTDAPWKLYVDPVAGTIIALLMGGLSIPILMESADMLLQKTPPSVCTHSLHADLAELGVRVNTKDTKLWMLTPGHAVGTVSVVAPPQTVATRHNVLVHRISSVMADHGCAECTVQIVYDTEHMPLPTAKEATKDATKLL